jgi:hypothetical protein
MKVEVGCVGFDDKAWSFGVGVGREQSEQGEQGEEHCSKEGAD